MAHLPNNLFSERLLTSARVSGFFGYDRMEALREVGNMIPQDMLRGVSRTLLASLHQARPPTSLDLVCIDLKASLITNRSINDFESLLTTEFDPDMYRARDQQQELRPADDAHEPVRHGYLAVRFRLHAPRL